MTTQTGIDLRKNDLSQNEEFETSLPQNETPPEKPKKKRFAKMRKLFAPAKNYGAWAALMAFWGNAYRSFRQAKYEQGTPIRQETPFDEVCLSWGISPDRDMDSVWRGMLFWVCFLSVFMLLGMGLFLWGTNANVSTLFLIQALVMALFPPLPLVVTLWKMDILKSHRSIAFTDWFKKGFLGLSMIFVLFFVSAAFIQPTISSAAEEPAGGGISSIDFPSFSKLESGEKELSSKMLTAVLGADLDTLIKGGGALAGLGGILLEVFRALNLMALCFVSVFLVYIYSIGAVNGAQRGTWSDDQAFSSFWSPVRSAVAISFCAPFPSGLSLLQILILVSMIGSINFANNTAKILSARLGESGMFNLVEESLNSNGFSQVIPTIIDYTVAQAWSGINKGGTFSGNKDSAEVLIADTGTKINTGSGQRPSSTFDQPLYGGKLIFPVITTKDGGWFSSPIPQTKAFSITVTGQNGEGKELALKSLTEIKNFYEKIKFTVANMAIVDMDGKGNNFGELKKSLANEIKTFTETLATNEKTHKQNMFKSYSSSNGALGSVLMVKTAIDDYGWSVVGLFPFILTRAQNVLNDKSILTISFTAPEPDIITRFSDINKADQRTYLTKREDLFNVLEMLSKDEKYKALRSSIQSTKETSSGWSLVSKQFESSIPDGWLSATGFAKKLQTSNPVSILYSEASCLSGILVGGISGIGALVGAIEGAEKSIAGRLAELGGWGIAIGAVTGFLKIWVPVISFAVSAALAFCFMCMYMLPTLCLIYWIRAVLTWAIFCVQALVGAPFWAAAHALPEGKGFAGNHARQGYLMLLDIMIRPTLLVVGSILSLVFIFASGHFLGMMFEQWASITAVSTQSGGEGVAATVMDVINPIDRFAYLAIVMYLTYESCNFIFIQVVSNLPDNVMQWCGSRGMSADDASTASRSADQAGSGMKGIGTAAAGGLGSLAKGTKQRDPKDTKSGTQARAQGDSKTKGSNPA